MDIALKRKIYVNKWIIKARWLYVLSIFGIGIFSKAFVNGHQGFPYFLMLGVLFFMCFINFSILFLIKKTEKNPSYLKINLIGILQIAIEIIILTFIMNRSGGVDGVVFVFFIMPTISASLLFGTIGAVLTAIISAFAVDFLVIGEYYGFIAHFPRYEEDTIEFRVLKIGLFKMTIVSVFYIIVGAFSGFSASLLSKREKDVIKKENKLDETKNLLIQKSLNLSKTNHELDKKVKELKEAEKIQRHSLEDIKKERQKTEEEKNKISAIISNFVDPIIVLDSEHRLSLINPASTKIFNLNKENLGERIFKGADYSMEHFIKKEELGYELKITDDHSVEEITFNQNGEKTTYKVISTQVKGKNQESFGTMKIFYNLTREKMIDELKSQFITVAAHQLRTPLSAIKWAISLVLDGEMGEINEKQKEMLFKGFQSNEKIINLINDMLYVSRIEEGRFGYSFEYDDFNKIFEEALEEFNIKIKKEKLKLIINKPKERIKIYADKSKMLLVLKNLIKNAVEYTPEFGKIEITIKTEKNNLTFSIKDNGVGIPKESQEKIFSKFFRAQNVLRIQTEGSGLGLYITKNIIEKHGGKLNYESTEGVGSKFTFNLPLGN
jgi:signal transduction histidine kinase